MHPLNTHHIIRKYNEFNRFGDILGMHFEITEKGKVSYSVEVSPQLLATNLAAHGGLLAALCDGALGIAALSCVVEHECLVSTVDLNIKYLRPALLNDKVVAYAEVIQQGKRLLFSEAKVYNQRQELLATSSGTFNAYPFEKLARFQPGK